MERRHLKEKREGERRRKWDSVVKFFFNSINYPHEVQLSAYNYLHKHKNNTCLTISIKIFTQLLKLHALKKKDFLPL